jgi:hypothetical protein
MSLVTYTDTDGTVKRAYAVVILGDKTGSSVEHGSVTRYLDSDGVEIPATPLMILEDLRAPGSGGVSGDTTVVNDLTTGGTTYALSAEMGKTLNTLKAPLASPTFTGVPAVPTAAAGTSTTQAASTAFAMTAAANAVAALVNSAPTQLDTINELAAALGNDANFAATITAALAAKAPLASPTFTGIPAAPTAAVGTSTTQLATTAFAMVAAANAAAAAVAAIPAASSGASIESTTLATGSIGSSMDNTTQTAANGVTLTLTAGMITPSGFVIDAPGASGCTITWGSTFGVNGAANGAGTLTVPSGGYAMFRQKQGTDQYWIALGPNTDAIPPRTNAASFALVAADLGGESITDSNITVTCGTQSAGFWRAFAGAGVVTFTGSGVTVTDKRVSGASNPYCLIYYTSSTTAEIRGSKA